MHFVKVIELISEVFSRKVTEVLTNIPVDLPTVVVISACNFLPENTYHTCMQSLDARS